MDAAGLDAVQRCAVAIVAATAHGLDVATVALAALLGETGPATVPVAVAVGIGLAWLMVALACAVGVRRMAR